MVGRVTAEVAVRAPAHRAVTSPVLPLVLLSALMLVLLGEGFEIAALCSVAAVAGVALSGST